METINLFEGINKVSDLSEASDLEKKHLPIIECPDEVNAGQPFTVTITVGKEITHPDEKGHHIQWIELYLNDLFVARVDFTPEMSISPFSVQVKLDNSAKLMALSRCNLHGLWFNEKNIGV